MTVLKPPSAFMLPVLSDENVCLSPRTSSTEVQTLLADLRDTAAQTSDCFVTGNVAQLEECITAILSRDLRGIGLPSGLDSDFRPLWDALSKLGSSYTEKLETVQKLSAAVHRTVPEALEHQRIVQNLETDKKHSEKQIVEMAETISLLEKRMECQSKVLAIQEKTLTTEGACQKMLEAWRNKVLQMLIEREMENMSETRNGLALQSHVEKLEKICREHEYEIEILSNKNSDLMANLRLKEKHIQQITNELSVAQHSELKYGQLRTIINSTCGTLSENISNMGVDLEHFLPNEGSISDKLALYETQIERISNKVVILQSLYAEKEEFYSNKLETLLIEHTKPLQPVSKTSAPSQTELTWEEVEGNVSYLNERITEQEGKINSLIVEKGIVSSQLAATDAAKCDIKHELNNLREQLSTITVRHQDEVVTLQKHESKAAIRAKHLQRQVTKRESEIVELEQEFKERWGLEVEQFQEKLQKLQNENVSLRQALKRG